MDTAESNRRGGGCSLSSLSEKEDDGRFSPVLYSPCRMVLLIFGISLPNRFQNLETTFLVTVDRVISRRAGPAYIVKFSVLL